MCMVSNIGDSWKDNFPEKWPMFPAPQQQTFHNQPFPWQIPPEVTKKDIEDLRKELEELKKLLKASKEFDEKTGQPHCEMDAKVKFIKEVAKALCVDLGDVFEDKKG